MEKFTKIRGAERENEASLKWSISCNKQKAIGNSLLTVLPWQGSVVSSFEYKRELSFHAQTWPQE